MRYRHRFMIYNDDNGTIDFLNETNCKLNDRTTYFTIDLYSDNPEDMRIANILYEMGKIGGRVEEYTQIELDTAPWLATLPIWNDYYAEPSGGTPLKGKTFRPIKEPVCKKCYANLVQNTDIHIRPNLSKMKKQALLLYNVPDEMIVSLRFKELLLASDLRGFTFRNIISKSTKEPLTNAFQMVIERISEPLFDFSKMDVEDTTCMNCGAERHFERLGSPHVVSRKIMNQSDVDIFKAPEWLGRGWEHWRRIFISQKFYAFLRENKLDDAFGYIIPIIE